MYNKLTKELAICGLNAVRTAGEVHPEQINRLFLREDRLKIFTAVCKDLALRKRPYKLCEDEELERICKSHHHQGIVAMIREPLVEPMSPEDLERWAQARQVGLALHSVGNDHNLGAIVRSAAFFGASPLVISEADPEARLSTSAYRVAEGGMEHVLLRRVRNTAAFLRDASRHIITIGAELRARQRLGDLEAIIREQVKALRLPSRAEFPGIVIVLGNEEEGLPPAVRDACSVLVRIPGTGVIESLNVAQAAALFLHRLYE